MTTEVLPELRTWSVTYGRATARDDREALIGLVRAVFGWLDERGWARAWAIGIGDRVLEIASDGGYGADSETLLEVPWEVLAWDASLPGAHSRERSGRFVGPRRELSDRPPSRAP